MKIMLELWHSCKRQGALLCQAQWGMPERNSIKLVLLKLVLLKLAFGRYVFNDALGSRGIYFFTPKLMPANF